jgi:peptidoglycan/xylan/chitin deacetylase (PgdA/CDA1 family)
MADPAAKRVAITVDVEGDYGTSALRGVDEALPRLLDGFDRVGARAALFVVGDVARLRPAAIRRAAERGHAIGSHTMTHRPLSRLSPADRRAEIAGSRALLEDVTGTPCECFRAPFFDAPADLGPLLEEAGYRWSSSKAPFSPVSHYRDVLSTRAPHPLAGSRVMEHPVPGLWGLPIPEGLSYRRLFWPATALPARAPSVFYLHPYELLDGAGAFAYSRWVRPLMTRKQGAWAEAHLFALLARWKSEGCVLEPPDAP